MIKYFITIAVILDDYEYNLVSDLLEDYNALARPSLSHSDPTNVTFDLSLSQLIDVVTNFLRIDFSDISFSFFC